MIKDYSEPLVSFLVLDFRKPTETRLLLESLKRHVKFPHKVIYLHNGGDQDHGYYYFRDGLIDQFIQTRENNGLGVGTRDLFAACFSDYALYVQNDQILGFDFTERMLHDYIGALNTNMGDKHVASISLAGPTAGLSVYSERAHLIETKFYKEMESTMLLPTFGAGPYSHGEWREAAIQRYYRENDMIHFSPPPIFIDNGVWTIRDCAGGRVKMRTDTKQVWWETSPTESYVFPEHTEQEWAAAIGGRWPGGKVPQMYLDRKESFNCWGERA